MTTPRHKLVDQTRPLYYHVVSRCVRQSWLCGRRKHRDYSHRKQWLLQRLQQLALAFPIEVHAYAIMSNHFHLVVYYDPLANECWSDEEVADRWLAACPPTQNGAIDIQRGLDRKDALMSNPGRLQQVRAQLGSISTFMQLLKQPIARRANLEDGCKGHFFEQRFYCAALLNEEALVAAMAYVDLNPIRAKIANTLEESEHASIRHRLHNEPTAQEIKPVWSGLPKRQPDIHLTVGDYTTRLTTLIDSKPQSGKQRRWQQHVALLKKKQRAFGPINLISQWVADRGFQLREVPMP